MPQSKFALSIVTSTMLLGCTTEERIDADGPARHQGGLTGGGDTDRQLLPPDTASLNILDPTEAPIEVPFYDTGEADIRRDVAPTDRDPTTDTTTTGRSDTYAAEIRPTVGETVEGVLSLDPRAGEIRVWGELRGLFPGKPHTIALHGFADGSDATCSGPHTPPLPVVPQAGAPLLEIGTVLIDHNGKVEVDFRAPMDTLPAALAHQVLIVHGSMRGEEFAPDWPAGCGEVALGEATTELGRPVDDPSYPP